MFFFKFDEIKCNYNNNSVNKINSKSVTVSVRCIGVNATRAVSV